MKIKIEFEFDTKNLTPRQVLAHIARQATETAMPNLGIEIDNNLATEKVVDAVMVAMSHVPLEDYMK